MKSEQTRERSNARSQPRLSRTRLVMGLLLIVAIAIFIGLADKAAHENAQAIRQILGR